MMSKLILPPGMESPEESKPEPQEDDGQPFMMVGIEEDLVVLMFRKQIQRIDLSPKQAKELAAILKVRALRIQAKNKKRKKK